jgi:glycosyltransferase involved in cell wall biosynthesis
MIKDKKIALVHDFLVQYGGAERVLEVLAEMFPEAPIYTLLYDKEKMRGKFKHNKICTSFLQRFPKILRKRYHWLLPFFPVAPETFDLREYDLIISSSGAWSKGIIIKLNTTHIAYIHSPMRFVWDYNEKYLSEDRKEKLKFLVRPFLTYLRIWDKSASDRPDYLIANSKYTKDRIEKYYRRESVVICPPVNSPSLIRPSVTFSQREKGDEDKYFLIVSRLSTYKKIDCVIEAFNKLELPLVIIGEGRDEKRLKSIANKNIRFLGWQSDEKAAKYYSSARAFIFSAIDDFGIAPVEAMMHGVPVLAIRKGGAKEIVEEGITGEFFDAQIPEIVADCVRRFMEKEKEYDKTLIVEKAKGFSKERFKRELGEYIEGIMKNVNLKMQSDK